MLKYGIMKAGEVRKLAKAYLEANRKEEKVEFNFLQDERWTEK